MSAFGAFLDPVADKVMVSTALILLCIDPPAPLSPVALSLPVSLIIGREICMSALREWAASNSSEAHRAVKVNTLGKWKTALQMTAMSLLLVGRRAHELLEGPWGMDLGAAVSLGLPVHVLLGSFVWDAIRLAFFMLWAAAGLAVWSFGIYFK